MKGEIRQLLSDSPSLARRLTAEALQDCYTDAAGAVGAEYDVKPEAQCPFTWGDVLPSAGPRKA
jgi:hypothetical protein